MSDPADRELAVRELSLYNVGRAPPEKVIAAFAVRGDQLAAVVADILSEREDSRPQHHLVVGQRGMGKTMLVARVAAELRVREDARARFVPLLFAEEQYAVDRLSKFWLNCLDSLADALEAERDTAAVESIDAAIAKLQGTARRAARDDAPFAAEVHAAFADAAAHTGRRPVLLVDNLQMVFERLSGEEQHVLRELLTRPGAPILVGASPTPPPQDPDRGYGAAFYDHFKVHYLRPLDTAAMRALLLHLADTTGRADVRERVVAQPGRLEVLRQLTGGNPRTTLTLFQLYAEDFAPDAFGDLEGLLDRVTPLYKHRFEELSQQQQVVTAAIADHWDPTTGAKIAEATSLPASTISAQLDRLERLGVVERVTLHGTPSTGYQLAERFFNIWFLMRSSSRRKRREVEFLVRFLQSFYEPGDRLRLARVLLGELAYSEDRAQLARAVVACLGDPATAGDLERHVQLALLRRGATGARDEAEPETVEFDELRRTLEAAVPSGAAITPDEFASTILGSIFHFETNSRQEVLNLLRRGEDPVMLADVRLFDQEFFAPRSSIRAVSWLSYRLSSGQLRHRRDARDWNRAFAHAPDPETVGLLLELFPPALVIGLGEDTRRLIAQNFHRAAPSTRAWWFRSLERLGFRGEAERAIADGASYCVPAPMQAGWLGEFDSWLALLRDNFQLDDRARAAAAAAASSEPFASGDIRHLHRAIFSAYGGDSVGVREGLTEALERVTSPLVIEVWIRAAAVIFHLGHGPDLINVLDSGAVVVAPLRPWVEAVNAYADGDAGKLENIAPETRSVAQATLGSIAAHVAMLPIVTRRGPSAPASAARADRARSGRRAP